MDRAQQSFSKGSGRTPGAQGQRRERERGLPAGASAGRRSRRGSGSRRGADQQCSPSPSEIEAAVLGMGSALSALALPPGAGARGRGQQQQPRPWGSNARPPDPAGAYPGPAHGSHKSRGRGRQTGPPGGNVPGRLSPAPLVRAHEVGAPSREPAGLGPRESKLSSLAPLRLVPATAALVSWPPRWWAVESARKTAVPGPPATAGYPPRVMCSAFFACHQHDMSGNPFFGTTRQYPPRPAPPAQPHQGQELCSLGSGCWRHLAPPRGCAGNSMPTSPDWGWC